MNALDPRRKKLLASKLGDLLDWSVPALEDVIGPFDPSVFHDYHEGLAALIARCEDELCSYSDDEIDILVSSDRPELNDLRKHWVGFAEADVRRYAKKPPWYAGGFGQPDYQADLAHWARMPSFTIAEATCLSVGVDPKHFSKRRLEKLSSGNRDDFWPPLTFLLERHKQLQRVFGLDRERPVRAKYFADWAVQVEFEIQPTFLDLLQRYHGGSPGAAEAGRESATPSKREIDKIAQLLTAMAIDDYGYDPDANRNKVHGDLADLAAAMGLEIHPDTIRKYLRIGAGFLPKDWKQSRNKSLND